MTITLPSWRSLLMPLAVAIAFMLTAVPSQSFASGHGSHGEAEEEEVVESATGFRGVELGEFSIRTFRAAPARRDEVNFTLHAAVKNEEFKNFDQVYSQRAKKVRDQVISATRLVPVEAYDDPDLTMLRRRILLRLRRTLPELKIDDVHVSDFNLRVDGV
jgi:hypothetical protein